MAQLRRGESQAGVIQRFVNLTMDTVEDVERYTSQSSGEWGAFPGTPVQVGALTTAFAPNHNWEYLIPYEITTERSGTVTGELPLKFILQ